MATRKQYERLLFRERDSLDRIGGYGSALHRLCESMDRSGSPRAYDRYCERDRVKKRGTAGPIGIVIAAGAHDVNVRWPDGSGTVEGNHNVELA